MKLYESQQVEQQTIGTFDEIQSSIRAEDLGFALEAVSKNLYSNPIGSFIRELVSNAVDANVDNDATALVRVNIYKEGNDWYFSVRDYGKGMTKEHFETVYMKWFNSDKRGTNTKIGGWGLGSKTPLAYREDYELETIVDGIKYSYIIVKQNPVPAATLLSEEKTYEPSGTLVKFIIKESDLYNIYEECNQQLVYFDNVIVINEKYYYGNDFKILDAEKFRYRPDKSPFDNDMHIVIGQVPYKIDFNILGINRIAMPIGIKFNIGELPVTLSRESINYNHEHVDVKKIIIDKINEVIKDISDRYTESIVFESLIDYLKYIDSSYAYVMLGEYKLKIDKNVIKANPIFKIGEYEYNFDSNEVRYLVEVFNYQDLKNFKFKDNYQTDLVKIIARYDAVYKNSTAYHWSNKYNDGKLIITSKTRNRSNIIRFAKYFSSLYKDEYRPFEYSRFRNRNKLKVPFKQVYVLWTYIEKTVIDSLPNYKDVPQSYIDEQKSIQKEAEDARKGTITVYEDNRAVENISIEFLYNNYDYIFYINRKESDYEIAHYAALFKTLPKYFKKKLKLIFITPTTIKSIKKIDKFKPVEMIWKYNKLRNHFNRLLIAEEVDKLPYPLYYSEISKYYYNLHCALVSEYISKLNIESVIYIYSLHNKDMVEININFTSHFERYMNKLKNNKSYKYEPYIKEIRKVTDYLEIASIVLASNRGKSQPYRLIKSLMNKFHLTKINRFNN